MGKRVRQKQRAAVAKHSPGTTPPGVEVGAGSHEHLEAVVVPLLDLRALAQSRTAARTSPRGWGTEGRRCDAAQMYSRQRAGRPN